MWRCSFDRAAQIGPRRVESVLARVEKANGRILPRPVVIEGNLTRPGLGIDAADVRWIGRHCDAVLHNAANLTFEGVAPGEPWLSNVQGTRELLQLCRATGVRRFHHISTAYVCGRRKKGGSWKPNWTKASSSTTITSGARPRPRRYCAASASRQIDRLSTLDYHW